MENAAVAVLETGSMDRKLRRWRIATAALIAALLCFAMPAQVFRPALAEAESALPAALEISCSIRPGTMVSPGEVTATFTIANVSDQSVQNITLTSEDGLLSESIGRIGPGEAQTLTRPYTVTQEELEGGHIDFTVSHDPGDPELERASFALSVPVARSEPQPAVDFTRQISSDTVALGGLATVTYKVRNTGNVPLAELRVSDALGDFTGRLEQLGVGETRTFVNRVAIHGESASEPELEYVDPSGERRTRALDAVKIHVANGQLEATFAVARSVFESDTADAILTLASSGDTGYDSITVLDDVYGGIIADALSVPGGGSPVEVAYTYPLRGETQYRWRITGTSETGAPVDMLTDTVILSNAPTDETVAISLEAVPRTPRISRAGRVTFDFTIANNGTVMARDALLYEVNRGEIRRLAVLPTGDPSVCTADYDVQADEQFIFCLNYTDAQGRQRTVSTTPIDVRITPDGATPEQPETDDPGLKGGSVKLGNSSLTFVAVLIIAGAALLVMFSILLAASARARRERKQRLAAERQRIKEEMGKTNPFTPVKVKPVKRKKK